MNYILPENLDSLLPHLKVIDVRDDDWADIKCIPNSINLKSTLITLDLLEIFLTNEYYNNFNVNFVFHCMYSQVRGPKIAIMAQEIKERINLPINIYVLKDGIIGWKKWNDGLSLNE